ncbi:TonB-dependent receptor [Hellea balneolensis]|uniref:TonB-dependent receptor n=1 Tax=Hellea balneolensis TaxID=287478 RepID=UPI00041A7B47|nr:TonB-dependent receptor [Hellea balneolensis]
MPYGPTKIFGILAIPSLALSQPSFALDDTSAIIVTATKIEKDIQDLGLRVSVVEGDVLSTFDGAEDLTQRVSGLQAAVANGSQVAFQIRGIGAVDHQALTPTAAAVYVDGTYQATNVQTSPLLFDIDRAEVLKGPQGSLYGRNSSSGAINFNSVLPGETKTGYIGAEYGTFDRINIVGAATLPVSDIFSLRLSGRYLNQDATLDNVVTNDTVTAPKEAGGKRDEFGLRAIGRLQASPNTEVFLNAHYAEDNGINQAPLNSSRDVDKHEISIGPDGIQDTDNEFYGTSVNVTHDFGDFALVSHTAYTGYNQQYGFDFDGTPAPFNVGSLNANLAYDRDFTQISEELRLSFNTDKVELMGGLYLEAEDFDQEYLIWCGVLNPDTLLGTCRYVGAPGRAGPTPASTGTATTLQSLITQSRKTAALFTYNTIEIAPQLDVVLGGRLTHEIIKGRGEGRHYFDDGIIALNNRDGLGLAKGSNKISDTRFSGNIGLNYTLMDNTLLYATYSNGFKSGGFNGEVINNATHFSDEGLFGGETVDALEAGIKFSRENVAFNLAGFYQFYDRPQARIFVPFATENGGSFTSNSLSNLDEATSYGLEGDISWTPVEGLDLFAGATWLDTEINQEENPNVPQNAATFDGNPLPFASKFSGVVSARYEWALSDGLNASVQGNGKYQSAFFLDAEGLEDRRQHGYEIIDGSANLHFNSGIDVGIWGRNLSNSDYAVSGFGFIGYNMFRGAPRSYGVSVKYSY